MLHKKVFLCICCLLASAFLPSCNEKEKKDERPSFKEFEGIKYVEVRREFNTGFSFSEQGFQQKPEWTLYFLPGDSVKIYSPFEKRYIEYPIYYDHAQVINFAREWLRVIHVSKDSMTLQLLRVKSKKVVKELSTVYMRYYSEDYIKNVLHENPDRMRRPTKKDTAYVLKLISKANKKPLQADSLFAARIPVILKSTIPEIKVSRTVSDKDNPDYSPSDEYLYPEYDILIEKAYKDFAFNFSVMVDEKGRLTVGNFAVADKEFEQTRRKVLQGIIDVYLQRFLEVSPGTTLNIPHATELMLHVKGTID